MGMALRPLSPEEERYTSEINRYVLYTVREMQRQRKSGLMEDTFSR